MTVYNISDSKPTPVDLQRQVAIDRVRIVNRRNARLMDRLAGAEIQVGNIDRYNGNPACATGLPGEYVVDFPCVATGRYVFVVQPLEYNKETGLRTCLHFAEVEVLAGGGRLSRVGECANHRGVLRLNGTGITSVEPGAFKNMSALT